MILQHFQCDLLCVGDAVAVADSNDKVLAPIAVARVVVNVALVDPGIRDLHVIAVLGHEDCGPRGKPLYKAHDPVYVHQVTGLEWRLQTKENAGQKVLCDILECNTEN